MSVAAALLRTRVRPRHGDVEPGRVTPRRISKVVLVKMTLDTYADLFDDDLDAVAVTLHARYSPESVPKMCPPDAQEAPQ